MHGACHGPPGVNQGQLCDSPIDINMVENFIVIQLTLTEIFVSQDFTIRTNLGLIEPANACE